MRKHHKRCRAWLRLRAALAADAFLIGMIILGQYAAGILGAILAAAIAGFIIVKAYHSRPYGNKPPDAGDLARNIED